MGSSSLQLQVTVPSRPVLRFRSSPAPNAVWPAGTVMVVSNAALSLGWLLDGNHACAPIGSPTTKLLSHTCAPPAGV